MRWNGCFISIALAALMSGAAPCHAATFGTVVPIGGHASDIALDESRGLLYIANFTANRIEVMSTADYSIHSSMNVAAQPAALAISADAKYLLVAHYGNLTAPDPSRNAVTLINLGDGTRQTFTTGDPPLGVAFLADGRGIIVTTTSLVVFDPISGAMSQMASYTSLGKQIPVPLATFPTQVVLASVATNPDKTVMYALTDDGAAQGFIRLDIRPGGSLVGFGIVASPKPLPRVSVSADGSRAIMNQYLVDPFANDLAQFPNALASPNPGAAAIDSRTGNIWGQIQTGFTTTTTNPLGISNTTTTVNPAVLSLMDGENLNVIESYSLPENLTGRALLTAANDVLYAVSDSGVMVFPIGRMNQQHRLKASVSDVVARGSFCNRSVITQTITITDPGGGNTDFALFLASNTPGVTISPSVGITPAQVQVRVDPTAFQNQQGTLAVNINMNSSSAVNLPPPIRLLINNRNPDQRGTFINIPGTLTDLLADPVRNRFYVVQQDQDQVLVFDSTSYQQIASLKTSATPTQLAFTFDRKYLIIGHDNAQQAWVYDLDSLQRQQAIQFPPGHYPRSIAESGNALLALVRNAGQGGPGMIDRIDFASRRANSPPTLGIWNNNVNPAGVLAPSPNGASVMIAMPDGNIMLYDANADTFSVSRKDFTTLGGAYAASSFNTYVVGNNLLNASLVPSGTLESTSGSPAGFAYVDTGGYRTTTSAVSSPGVIERYTSSQGTGSATRMVEATRMPSGFMSFMRTLAPLYDRSGIIALTVSGITVLPWNYDAAVAPPKITAVVNAADGTKPVAPGGLISVYGTQMAPVNLATNQIPLPTALADSCLTVNGIAVPVLFVSSTQINGQLPFNVDGNAQMTLRTPGGISDNFNFAILPAAPSIFRTGAAGPETGLATITRADNGQLITPTNPVHYGDAITIWATGLGRTNPPIDSGMAAPSDPLPAAVIQPAVTLGGAALRVDYAGLVPGSVGLYQINATVPSGVPQGLDIPLVINQGGSTTTLSMRVVK